MIDFFPVEMWTLKNLTKLTIDDASCTFFLFRMDWVTSFSCLFFFSSFGRGCSCNDSAGARAFAVTGVMDIRVSQPFLICS